MAHDKHRDENWLDELGEKVHPVVKDTDHQPGVNGLENAEHPTRDPDPNAMFGEIFDETLENVEHFFQGTEEEEEGKS